MAVDIDLLCRAVMQENAVDLFLREEEVPQVRMQGKIMELGEEPLGSAEMTAFWKRCGADPEVVKDKDASYTAADGTRYRVNLHRHVGKRGAVLRPVKREIPGLGDLGLPEERVTRWLERSEGVVLVAGATGMGKSTSIASMLQWMSYNQNRHVVTVEDPIEYLLADKNCIFTQREVGADTDSLERGLTSAMRQSPDVIFLGEILEAGPAAVALQAAETGHLLLTTLHSPTVSDTIERFANFFPSTKRESVLHVLSKQLIGVLCQKLLPGVNGEPVLVVEYFQNEGATADWIRKGEFTKIADLVARGGSPDSRGFQESILEAVKAGRISEETGEVYSGNVIEFQRAMRGISGGS